MTVQTFETLYRYYVIDGVSNSGKHKPLKRDIIDTMNDLKAQIALALANEYPKENVKFVVTAAGNVNNGGTFDGYVATTGERYLDMQGGPSGAANSANGIKIVSASGGNSRATDMDAAAEFVLASAFVENGTTYGGTRWKTDQTTAVGFTPGTSTFRWVQLQLKPSDAASEVATARASFDTLNDRLNSLQSGITQETIRHRSASSASTLISEASTWAFTDPLITNSTGFSGWGCTSIGNGPIDGFSIMLAPGSTVHHYSAIVVERPLADTSHSTLPGYGANDVVLDYLSPTVLAEPIAPTTPAVPTSYTNRTEMEGIYNIRALFAQQLNRLASKRYIFLVRAFKADDTPAEIGRVVSNIGTGGELDFARGYNYSSSGDPDMLTGLAQTGSTTGPVKTLYRYIWQPMRNAITPRFTGTAVPTGLQVSLANVSRVSNRGVRNITAGNGASTAAANAVSESQTNVLLGATGTSTALINLGRNWTTVVEIRRTSDDVVLTPNVDYVARANGTVISLMGSPVNIDIDYTYSKSRLDLICENEDTMLTLNVSGAERDFSAHEKPYRAKLPSAQYRPLFYSYVVGNTIREVIPAHQFSDIWPLNQLDSAEHQFWIARARSLLPRTRSRIADKLGILVAGYGDSITSMGGPSYVGPSSFEPNITGKNAKPFLGLAYGHANEASFITAWDADPANAIISVSDGVVTTDFYPGSTVFGVLDVLKECGYTWGIGGSAGSKTPGAGQFFYLNQGINSTTCASTEGNMLDPNRLAKLFKSTDYRKPDLVVFAPGMNLDANGINNNLSVQAQLIIQAIQGAGIEVLMYGSYITPENGKRYTLDGWRKTQEQLERAAYYTNCAFIPMTLVADPGGLSYANKLAGFFGITRDQACAANGLNHPGPWEMERFGKLLGMPLKP
jgi:hypothetical protein